MFTEKSQSVIHRLLTTSVNKELFKEALSSCYIYQPAITQEYEKNKPIISIILTCYYRLDYIKQATQSLLNQNYKNVEIILVDNGAHHDVKEYLIDFHQANANCSLITFKINQFEWSDSCKEAAVCWNIALIHSVGEYISHLSYDDLISFDYATRMVRLFEENSDCITAAPMPYSINSMGEVNNSVWLHELNNREKYIDGADIAYDFIKGSPRKLFGAPGEIFVIRRDVLISNGGFDRIIDISQLLKYAIMGVSGFDPKAALYWRHHNNQVNKQSKNRGIIFYSSTVRGWTESGILELWQKRFNAEKVNALLEYKKKSLRAGVEAVIRENTRQKYIVAIIFAFINVIKECPILFPRMIYVFIRELYVMLSEKLLR